MPPVVEEHHRLDLSPVSAEGPQGAARGGVPQPDPAVSAPARQEAAVGAQVEASGRGVEGAQDFTGVRGQELDGAADGGEGRGASVRGEAEGIAEHVPHRHERPLARSVRVTQEDRALRPVEQQ